MPRYSGGRPAVLPIRQTLVCDPRLAGLAASPRQLPPGLRGPRPQGCGSPRLFFSSCRPRGPRRSQGRGHLRLPSPAASSQTVSRARTPPGPNSRGASPIRLLSFSARPGSAASPPPRIQRGEASPAAPPRLRQPPRSNVRLGSRAPVQSIGRLPSKARPGPRDGPFLVLHSTSDLRVRASRFQEVPRQPSLTDGI
ncbi:hypothetical protein NDU88_002391 [Pleurodeles waltl]|uniref:Uncharacterized protein n=1 Tax=Pleurodeles waltl TaxID=8319 RepID=A0AAV7WQJ3_PLEWA|nr:hypothetical protein NDU88_002391 [Pleurodeles waltl]